LPAFRATATQASSALSRELGFALARSAGRLPGELPAAQLFEVNLGQLGWAYTFMSLEVWPLLPELRQASRSLGRAFDAHHHRWPPPAAVLPQAAARRSEATGRREELERPRLVCVLPGLCLVLKPPGWEVDTEGDSNIQHLSRFLQAALPSEQRDVAHRPDFAYGFIHRLDTPSSGLLLAATSFEGYAHLEWQMYTYAIAREYFVVGHGLPEAAETEVDQRIVDTKIAAVSERGRPARTFIRGLMAADCGQSNGRETVCALAIRIFTGRRHQIRVHLQHLHLPSATDGRYTLGSEIFIRFKPEEIALGQA